MPHGLTPSGQSLLSFNYGRLQWQAIGFVGSHMRSLKIDDRIICA
jgi:hypothetical protein